MALPVHVWIAARLADPLSLAFTGVIGAPDSADPELDGVRGDVAAWLKRRPFQISRNRSVLLCKTILRLSSADTHNWNFHNYSAVINAGLLRGAVFSRILEYHARTKWLPTAAASLQR
jgi:hypothetical protein